jgi:hypothetical protein
MHSTQSMGANEFFDRTLKPQLARATTSKVQESRRRAGVTARLAGWATVLCFLAGIWVDWRFLPTMVIPASLYVFYNLIRGSIDRELERRTSRPDPQVRDHTD